MSKRAIFSAALISFYLGLAQPAIGNDQPKTRKDVDPCASKINDRVAYSECRLDAVADQFDKASEQGLIKEKDAREAREITNMYKFLGRGGIIKRGVPRTDLGSSDQRATPDEATRIAKENLDSASAERLQKEIDAETQRSRQEEYEQKLAREAQAIELERRRVEDIRAAAEEAFLRGDYSSSLKLSAQVGSHRVADSLYNLGKNYEEGRTVKRNLVTALVFYQLASEIDQKYSKKYDRLWTAYIRESAYDPIKYAGINNWMGRFYGECRRSNYQSCDGL